MDTNGLVTIAENKGTADGRALAKELITPTASPAPWSFSQLIAGLMAAITSTCYVLVDFVNRKVLFTDSTADRVAMIGDPGDIDGVVLMPVAGQSGTSLLWCTDATTGAPSQSAVNAINAAIAPVPLKISAAALAQKLALLVDDNNNPIVKAVMIDQAEARLYVFTAEPTVAEPTAGNSGVLTVEGDSDPTDPKLPFEGGEV